MNGETGQVRTALVENLKELHLPAIRGCFEETARRAEKETLSYERYLLELAQRECEERRRKRIGKLLKESGLPLEKSLANFDGKRLPVKVSRQMKVLLEGGFLDRKENLLIFGNPGAGKSHLLCAIAQELIAVRGRKIKYATCALLVQDLLAAKRDLRLEAWKSRNRETGEVRRPHHRRDGIRAAKSRGDGGGVHTVGGAL